MMSMLQRLAWQIPNTLRLNAIQTSPALRLLSTSGIARSAENEEPGTELTPGEKRLTNKIQQSFPEATYVQVADVSGGCGAMYQISIESPKFKGMRTIQQHRMVNEALAEEIKGMHGLQLNTKAPDA